MSDDTSSHVRVSHLYDELLSIIRDWPHLMSVSVHGVQIKMNWTFRLAKPEISLSIFMEFSNLRSAQTPEEYRSVIHCCPWWKAGIVFDAFELTEGCASRG